MHRQQGRCIPERKLSVRTSLNLTVRCAGVPFTEEIEAAAITSLCAKVRFKWQFVLGDYLHVLAFAYDPQPKLELASAQLTSATDANESERLPSHSDHAARSTRQACEVLITGVFVADSVQFAAEMC